MKKNLCKLSALFIVFAMLFSVCVIPAHAGSLVSDDSIACAEELKNEYHEAADSLDMEINQEYLANSYEANMTFNKILESIESCDSELRSHYSGSYINDNGYLVVALCCDTGNCKKEIEDNLSCSEVLFEEGTGSYYYGQKELDAINQQISSLSESVKSDKAVSAETRSLMQTLPRTSYNEKDNTTAIIFNVSEEVEEAVLKSEKITNHSDTKKVSVKLSDSELQALNQFHDLIASFKENVNCSDDISYTVCTDYEQGEDQTESWRPGRYLFVYNNPSAGLGSALSTGYRAKYTQNGTTYYGFVTCGHGTSIGNSVYISNNVSSVNKLGTILNRSYGDRIDVSFISMTNENYTNGNAIYYTGSQAGATTPGRILDGTQTTADLNSCIYKSGATTYLTSGYVSSNTCSGYWNGTYFYDLMQADRNMGDNGDSGAVTYIIDRNTIYGKAVGVLKGASDNRTVFIKASNIQSDFGAVAY